MKELSTKEALELGISTYHNEMDNGEKRFRLSTQTGSSYILTLSPSEASWQNSHYHEKKKEFYVVEKGWVLMVTLENEKMNIKKLEADECFFVPVGTKHNIYISENTVLHTVKFGTEEMDWNPCPDLDEMLKAVKVENYL